MYAYNTHTQKTHNGAAIGVQKSIRLYNAIIILHTTAVVEIKVEMFYITHSVAAYYTSKSL